MTLSDPHFESANVSFTVTEAGCWSWF